MLKFDTKAEAEAWVYVHKTWSGRGIYDDRVYEPEERNGKWVLRRWSCDRHGQYQPAGYA